MGIPDFPRFNNTLRNPSFKPTRDFVMYESGRASGKTFRKSTQNMKHIAVICYYRRDFEEYVMSMVRKSNWKYPCESYGYKIIFKNTVYTHINERRNIYGYRFNYIKLLSKYGPSHFNADYLINTIEQGYLFKFNLGKICEICNRVHGNKRKNQTLYDENRAVELKTGTTTEITKTALECIESKEVHYLYLCQSCKLRIVTQETAYLYLSVRKPRFKRKNELATGEFTLVSVKP
jgi:hypothetical protein